MVRLSFRGFPVLFLSSGNLFRATLIHSAYVLILFTPFAQNPLTFATLHVRLYIVAQFSVQQLFSSNFS